MAMIQVCDLKFEKYISADSISQRIKELAAEINSDLKNEQPLFLGILNGAFMFASDLMKEVSIDCEITFVKLASYQGTTSTGNVRTLVGLDKNISGRTIVIVEDIIDTGKTLHEFLPVLNTLQPKKILIASLLLKREALKHLLDFHYIGFDVPDKFLVGYGLDYDGLGRNLRDIYVKTS